MNKITSKIKSDQISGVLLLFFGLFIIFQAKELGSEARFIPWIVASLIIIFSIVICIQSFKLINVEVVSKKIKRKYIGKKLIYIVILTVIYMFIMPVIGFEIASFCYLLIVISIIEKRFFWLSTLISFLVTVSLILIFSLGMDLRIPLLFSKLFNLKAMIIESFLHLISSPETLIFMVLGVGFGVFLGALPGFGATLGIAMLIPFTYGMDPNLALPMLAGIYSGAIYGGGITAIMVGIPGTSAAAATVSDGFAMTKKGESKKALTTSAISSSFGGFVGGFSLLLLAPILAKFSLWFGPAEYFMLAVFGLTIIATVVGKSMIKGIISGLLGLALSLIGLDPITGEPRFTFDQILLLDGLPLIPVILGLFAFPQSLKMINNALKGASGNLSGRKGFETGFAIKIKEILKHWKTMLRSSVLGTLIGIIPGAGANIACWIGISEAKRVSKHPEKFGTGITEGVIAAEAANNATEGGSLIPMLTLSIPGSGASAVMFGALMIHGMVPGPDLFTKYAAVTYNYIWAIIINSVFLLFIGYYGSRFFARLANIPVKYLAPVMIVITLLGGFATRQLNFDIGITIIIGTATYLLINNGFSAPPILLGFILGPIAEKGFRRAMLISDGDWTVFFTRPISLVILGLIVLSIYSVIRITKKSKENKI